MAIWFPTNCGKVIIAIFKTITEILLALMDGLQVKTLLIF